MIAIHADNRDVERCIKKLVKLSQACGASFADDIILRCAHGDLSIAAGSGNDALIRLPASSLVPFDKFQFSLSGDDLSILSCDPQKRPEHIGLAEAMLELYNLTGKISFHRRTSPWLFMASEPELLRIVMQGRDGPSVRQLAERVTTGDTANLALDTFMKSRIITVRNGTVEMVALMPVADFMNHSFQAVPFGFPEAKAGGGVIIGRSQPSRQAGGECFVSYGPYDDFDTWLNYGFFDGQVPFLRSVPLTVPLPGVGEIRVHAHIQGGRKTSLPPSLEDLRAYIPDIISRTDNGIDLSFLLIPGKGAPRALRRALAMVIGEMKPGHPGLEDLVALVEGVIIEKNRVYYTEFKNLVGSLALKEPVKKPVLDDLAHLCALQLARIEEYCRLTKA